MEAIEKGPCSCRFFPFICRLYPPNHKNPNIPKRPRFFPRKGNQLMMTGVSNLADALFWHIARSRTVMGRLGRAEDHLSPDRLVIEPNIQAEVQPKSLKISTFVKIGTNPFNSY